MKREIFREINIYNFFEPYVFLFLKIESINKQCINFQMSNEEERDECITSEVYQNLPKPRKFSKKSKGLRETLMENSLKHLENVKKSIHLEPPTMKYCEICKFHYKNEKHHNVSYTHIKNVKMVG